MVLRLGDVEGDETWETAQSVKGCRDFKRYSLALQRAAGEAVAFRIVDQRDAVGGLEYHVRWKNLQGLECSEDLDTWEPADSLVGSAAHATYQLALADEPSGA